MISGVWPLAVGNALRVFVTPPGSAVRWRVLRKGADTFTGFDDPAAAVAYEGNEPTFVDVAALQNEVRQFYRAYYTVDGITWVDGGLTNSGTPAAIYEELTTDVLTKLRERIEAGLVVEVERNTIAAPELGYVQVFSAAPSLEQSTRFPLVTLHMENEEPTERAIGESIGGDDFDEAFEGEGWLASVRVTVVGWSLNSDERNELRKALRRIVIGNLPVFDSFGGLQINFSQQDVDALSGEYGAPMYQAMCTFSCLAPVRVGGLVPTISDVIPPTASDVIARSF
jgi:hypothetical protein